MIEYALDHLFLQTDDKVFIIYNENLDDHDFSSIIANKYPFIQCIKIGDTRGASETLYLGIDLILHHAFEKCKGVKSDTFYHKKCLLLDCDTFYTEDVRDLFANAKSNAVFYTKNYEQNAIYSYIEMDETNEITNIKEKVKISDNANTGAYAFEDIDVLYSYCKHVVENNIVFQNEPYTSCVIAEMIQSGIVFEGIELDAKRVFSLGTPSAVNAYIDATYAFLFDLDGTMVITDEIYFEVWREILVKYNIVLTRDIFKTFIQGNNDKHVLNTLLKNVNLSLDELSAFKDEIFINSIDKIKMVDGIDSTVKTIKSLGHKLCIVTNCNRRVATEIVKKIRLDRYVDFIISSNDCIYGKPYPEPYMKAIEQYKIKTQKCIIFEDSKTGLLSAKGANPRTIVGIETLYDKSELIKYGCTMSIKHYLDISVDQFIHCERDATDYLKQLILKNTTIDNIKEIVMDENKLKGGFIADVISFNAITTNNKSYSLVLKYENDEINNLSFMAKKMELYEREYYFYTNISDAINVCIPKFYHLIIDEEKNKRVGIVLENLLDKNYKINLNLNTESIDVTLKIVDRMAKMHSKFWNKDVKRRFPELKKSNDPIFSPHFGEFIRERYNEFIQQWASILKPCDRINLDKICQNFDSIQQRFSESNRLTFIHGDIKSPNIFYDVENGFEPYFIDWQHCAIGKGTQDLMFFLIESFDITTIDLVWNTIKHYYYKKLVEYGVTEYSFDQYESDIYDSICYIPFFTSIWFGTTKQDELIDKNFPYFFISKFIYTLEHV